MEDLIAITFSVLLFVIVLRMGLAFDKRRELPLVSGHYVWPGHFVVDVGITDAQASAQAETNPLPGLEAVGEGG